MIYLTLAPRPENRKSNSLMAFLAKKVNKGKQFSIFELNFKAGIHIMAENKVFLLDPDNIPDVDYYLDGVKELDGSYPGCTNDAEELTINGFCKAANELIGPFGDALKEARKLNGNGR